MKQQIRVNRILLNKNTIKVQFSVSDSLKKYFNEYEFITEYSVSVEKVPYGIAVIPFVCNLLPFVWLKDCELLISEIDATFYQQISVIRESYRKMYPMLTFSGQVTVGKISQIRYDASKSLCFFSGGVDAFSTLLNHIEERPILFTIWGADIKYHDKKSWDIVMEQNQRTAQKYSLDLDYCKTNFRDFYNNDLFNALVRKTNDSWWHGFQHGMGLIGHAAPLSYILGLKKVYIASSYALESIPCASHPSIDNNIKWSTSSVVHDQFGWTRQEKINAICLYSTSSKLYPFLRVCWQNNVANNCNKCEKCLRTIMGIIVEGEDPNLYGFKVTPDNLIDNIENLKRNFVFSELNVSYWIEIQKRLLENKQIIREEYKKVCFLLLNINFNFFVTSSYKYRRYFRNILYLIKHPLYLVTLFYNKYINK